MRRHQRVVRCFFENVLEISKGMTNKDVKERKIHFREFFGVNILAHNSEDRAQGPCNSLSQLILSLNGNVSPDLDLLLV